MEHLTPLSPPNPLVCLLAPLTPPSCLGAVFSVTSSCGGDLPPEHSYPELPPGVAAAAAAEAALASMPGLKQALSVMEMALAQNSYLPQLLLYR